MEIPQAFYLFGRQFMTYPALLSVGIVLAIVLVAAFTPRGGRWAQVDLCLAGLALALVLARAEHVALRWEYYADHLDQALDLRRGGLGWHGAVLGALGGMWLWRWLRTTAGFATPALPWRALAIGLPLLALAAWLGCAAAGCAYGAEVRTLADHPPLVAAELRDVYGILAPRWNTPLYGALWSGFILAFSILHTARGSRAFLGFWLALALLALGMFVIGYARADVVLAAAALRGDQAFDAALLILALSVVIASLRRFRYALQ